MCNVFKPDRCHHCSVCNKCILNMDHHCPWINTCIGFYNRKFFLQMLFYIVILLIYSLFCNFSFAYHSVIEFAYSYSNINIIEHLVVIFLYLLDIAALVVLTLFFKFHLNLILENKTTIETIDKKNQMFNSPFDLGRSENFLQVFGHNKVLWFIPFKDSTGHPLGNGIDWSKKFELEDYDFTKSDAANTQEKESKAQKQPLNSESVRLFK